ncbi:hypothetical protein GCM10023322_07020 [Rugosimonospora acidiphila]|uniref:Uncharacterized protein n=1 Tax=Rugosimonospora acidiphila TaxID=556531 RepID=A0ABP9RK50_9ACTN
MALAGAIATVADALHPSGALAAAGWIIAATTGDIAAAVSIVFDDIVGLFRSTALAA